MPCHALRASCFIDPWGVVYPCITYSRPIGRLRETGMRLDPIWNAHETTQLQREIWKGQCPQCWTACEAYQSILGNVLAGRCRKPAADRPAAVRRAVRRRQSSHDERHLLHRRRDSGSPGQSGDASRGDRRVGGDCREAGSAEHRRRRPPDAPLRRRGHRRRRTLDRRHARARGAKRRQRPAGRRPRKGRGHSSGHPAYPHTRHGLPRRRRIARPGGHPAAGASRFSPTEADHVTASRLQGRIERAARRVRRVLPPRRQLVHHGVHQLAVQLPTERQPERLPRDPDERAPAAGPAREQHDDRAGNDHQDAAARIADGRSAQPRAPPGVMAARTSACGAARRATAVHSSNICSSERPGISARRQHREHSWHLGRARFGCRAAAGRPASIRGERGAVEPAQARGLVSRLARSTRVWRTQASRPEQIDVVAASTSDPAKTLGRWWPGSKERYYAVRRRKATARSPRRTDARGEVPDDRVVARAGLEGPQPPRTPAAARPSRAHARASSDSSIITRRTRRRRHGRQTSRRARF